MNEKIKNMFPELNYFIENPKGYQVLYHEGDKIHNEYPLDLEEARKIINCINNLQFEINRLEKLYVIAIEDCTESAIKYEKQVDNWNNLKEYIEQQVESPLGGREFCCYSNVKDKIQELDERPLNKGDR